MSKANLNINASTALHARLSTCETAQMCCRRKMITDFVERDEIISLAGDKKIVAKG